MTPTRTLVLSSLLCAAISGCGQPASDPASGTEGAEAGAAPAAGVRGDAAVRHAMQCWGVTNGAFMLHMAAPDQAAGLPRPTAQDFNAWANQGAILIRDQGGSLADYDALKEEYQVRLLTEEQRTELRPVLEDCLRTTPTAALDVEQPILTGE